MISGKDVVLTELAVTLARLLAHGGNRVGALLYDERLDRVVPARTGRTHVLRLSHELAKPRPPAAAPGTTTDLAAICASPLHRSPAFAGVPHLRFHHRDQLGAPPVPSRQRHEVVVVRLVDPLERELPEVGLIVVEDAETGEQVVADTSDPEFRRRYHLEVDAREQALQGWIRRAAARLNDISTDDDLAAALVEMVRRSRQPRR